MTKNMPEGFFLWVVFLRTLSQKAAQGERKKGTEAKTHTHTHTKEPKQKAIAIVKETISTPWPLFQKTSRLNVSRGVTQ